MANLEKSDEPITLKRAGEIAGLLPDTLRHAAQQGRLDAHRMGHDWLTTRRSLHRYLRSRRRGVSKPVPAAYRTPRGEEPIPTVRERASRKSSAPPLT
jgi:hypothetical protein